jgi:hypothetical protein
MAGTGQGDAARALEPIVRKVELFQRRQRTGIADRACHRVRQIEPPEVQSLQAGQPRCRHEPNQFRFRNSDLVLGTRIE